jgi:hypothetical protein
MTDSIRCLADMMARFRLCTSATAAERTAKDRLLDELQDAVGLAGQMTTERAIVHRAQTMLQKA